MREFLAGLIDQHSSVWSPLRAANIHGSPATPDFMFGVAHANTGGQDSAAGTEVTGGSYARKNLTVAAAVSGATSNSADLVWTGMPAATVVGVEIWDSAGTPVRLWYGALGANRTVASGDELKIVAGSLAISTS